MDNVARIVYVHIAQCTAYFTVENDIRRFNRKFLQGVVNIK